MKKKLLKKNITLNNSPKLAYFLFISSLFCFVFLTLKSFSFSSEIDSLFTDTMTSKDALDKKVISFAEDSIVYNLEDKKIYLYKNAEVTYGNINLKAAYIELDNDKNTVYATFLKDSLNKIYGRPIFSENNKTFTSKSIKYNFKTKKGIINDVITQEGEAFILGEKVKKQFDDILYTKRGRYTTCNNENPHFSIRSRKIKTIPGEKIITGPANLEIAGVPTPICLPFGYFPNQKKQSSGIIFPIYGESLNKGFFLNNGGYYFAINDYIDLKFKGDIYSNGTWNINLSSNYKKRYKYNGTLTLSYASLKSGNKGLNNYLDKRDFFIKWRHSQDVKANPSSRFTANLNVGSSSYHQNNSNISDDFLQNTYESNINYNKNWRNSNVSLSFRHFQNTLNNNINVKIPEINYSINRFYPLKGLNRSNKTKWFDKINIAYSLNARNEINTIDSLLFKKESIKNFKNGLKHNIPISGSFKFLKHFTLSPKFNYTERWYFNYINKSWNGTDIETDTINKFVRAYNYNFSTSLNTKIYGLINFKKGNIKAFRHVLSPNLSFNYTPDFSKDNFGFYKYVTTDNLGNTQQYSIFQNGIYGTPGNRKSGNISFGLNNIFELKTINKKDTINNIKKIKLIESLNISTSYNIYADSLNFSNINLTSRLKLFNLFNIVFRSSYDPYILNKNGQRINQFYFKEKYKFGRLTNANTSVGISLRPLLKEGEKDNYLDYMNFNIPWNLKIDYTLRYSKPIFEKNITKSLNFSGEVKLTKKWKFGFRSGYDFEEKNLTYTTIDIYRDLHCWEMLFKWIPFGFHKSYSFTIRVKASTLKDLKWEKKKNWYDY